MDGKKYLVKGYYLLALGIFMAVSVFVWQQLFSAGESVQGTEVVVSSKKVERALQVEVPAISVDEQSFLVRWNHVNQPKVADFHVYINGEPWPSVESGVGVDRLRLVKDVYGEALATMQATTYTVRGLLPDTSYTVQVKALSATGEVLEESDVVKVWTKRRSPRVSLRDRGIVGDGTTVHTKALQQAIDDTPIGGTLVIPAGVYRTGALFLHSYMTLELEEGAVLKSSDRGDDFLNPNQVKTGGTHYFALLNIGRDGEVLRDVRIVGAGALDGNGWTSPRQVWEEKRDIQSIEGPQDKATSLAYGWVQREGQLSKAQVEEAMNRGAGFERAYDTRSSIIHALGVQGLYVAGVHVYNSPHHGLVIDGGEHVIVNGASFYDYPEGSAIFLDGQNIWLGNTYLGYGDSLLKLRDSATGTSDVPTTNIVAANMVFANGGAGLVLEQQGQGWIQHVQVQDSLWERLAIGVLGRSMSKDGGGIHHLTVGHSFLTDVDRQGFLFTYVPRWEGIDPAQVKGMIRDVHVKDTFLAHIGGPTWQVDGLDKLHYRNILFRPVKVEDGQPPLVRYGDNVTLTLPDGMPQPVQPVQ